MSLLQLYKQSFIRAMVNPREGCSLGKWGSLSAVGRRCLYIQVNRRKFSGAMIK